MREIGSFMSESMSENLNSALQGMKMKPVQMALLVLGYSHDISVTDNGIALIVRQPGLTVTFRMDAVTSCVEAVFVWHAYLPAKKLQDHLKIVNEFNSPTRDLQVLLELVESKGVIVQAREFLFSGAGVSWEQATEFVHYCMTEVSQTFVSWCAQTWPKFAPEQIALQEPQPSDVPFEFDAQQRAEGNPFGLIDEPTQVVDLERIYATLGSLSAEGLVKRDGFVEFQLMGQRVSAWLTNGGDGRARQTLAVSSGTGMKVSSKKQMQKLLELCNQFTEAHVLVTVFTEEIENGARVGVFAEARLDLPAGLSDEQLESFLLNTSKWTAEVCLTVAYRAQN